MLQPISVPIIRGRSWRDRDLTIHHDTELFSGVDDAIARADKAIGTWITEILHRHYQGHLFHVTVDSRPTHMLARIRHPILPHNKGITLRLDDIDPNGAIVVRLAGQLLERYRIPRAALDVDAFLVAKQLTKGLNAIPE